MQCHNFRHLPKSHDEWLHVLQQQETLHNVEMQKWQKVLHAAVQMRRRVRGYNIMEHTYEGRLISNAHSEISRKRDHVFKQMKVGSKVQYFSYKLTYLFLI